MLKICIAAYIAISPSTNIHVQSISSFGRWRQDSPNQCTVTNLAGRNLTADKSCEEIQRLYVKAAKACNSTMITESITE